MNEYSYTERHMGTTVNLSFVCKNKEVADALAHSTFATIHTYEGLFSRFLPTSELSMLNHHGSAVVSDTFIAVLKRSLELAYLTNQVFNPLAQVATLGYRATYPSLAKEIGVISNTSYGTDVSKITIDEKTNFVALGPTQQLDFGGVLKGYLAGLLADEVTEENSDCTGCIINIGGDIATRGYDAVHEPFIFLLYNPVTGTEVPVTLTDTSLATSGTYARVWNTDSGPHHHIVDSSSRQNPTQNLVATSIVANDGALTEALTKLFLIKGVATAISTVSPEAYHYQYFIVSDTGDTHSTIV